MAGWFARSASPFLAARDLGAARVTAQKILVVLVERLLADEPSVTG